MNNSISADTELTSLNWLQNFGNIMNVPELPTPPNSPRNATQAPHTNKSIKKTLPMLRFQLSKLRFYLFTYFLNNLIINIVQYSIYYYVEFVT